MSYAQHGDLAPKVKTNGNQAKDKMDISIAKLEIDRQQTSEHRNGRKEAQWDPIQVCVAG